MPDDPRTPDVERTMQSLDEVLATAAVIVDEAELAPFATVADHVKRRRGFLGETVVVALAGGTGSGKSSLLNAIAGSEVASVGAVRPTTSRPLAWIPAEPEPGLVRLLDDLAIDTRVGHTAGFPHALIDLPDFDSVELDHRATVEALLPRIDVIIWVLDPQKYSDRLIHRHYLEPLAAYQEQFLFVLNQADRLSEADLAEVMEDLKRTLASDGITNPTFFVTAARPPTASPYGVDEIVEFMADEFAAKRVALGKLLVDIARAGTGIASVTGIDDRADLDWEDRWVHVKRSTVEKLTQMAAGPGVEATALKGGVRLAQQHGSGPVGRAASWLRRSRAGRALGVPTPTEGIRRTAGSWATRVGREGVLSGISGFVTEISVAAGGRVGTRLRTELDPVTIEREVAAAVEGTLAATGDMEPPRRRRWWSIAAAIQTLALIAVVVGGVWMWADPNPFERGTWPSAAIVAGGGLAVSIAVASAVRASGRRAGRHSYRAYRDAVEQALSERIDARLGMPIATTLRARDQLGEALGALSATVAAARRAITGG